jgi:hypothetical protein
MRKITLETGNIITNQRVYFYLVDDDDVIRMGDGHSEATFPSDQWSLFLEQLRDAFSPGQPKTSWIKRMFSFNPRYRIINLRNYPDSPLGSDEMRKLMVDNTVHTPSFQLFLATVDIANKFLFIKDNVKYNAYCIVFSGRIPSVHGSGGVYFIDNDWIDGDIEGVVDGNRLCEVVFDGNIKRYYIPYATPFKPKLSEPSSKTWDKIRDYYYARR